MRLESGCGVVEVDDGLFELDVFSETPLEGGGGGALVHTIVLWPSPAPGMSPMRSGVWPTGRPLVDKSRHSSQLPDDELLSDGVFSRSLGGCRCRWMALGASLGSTLRRLSL